jgi:hypothetical protein
MARTKASASTVPLAAERLQDLKPLGGAQQLGPDPLQQPLDAALLGLAFHDGGDVERHRVASCPSLDS